MEINIIVFAVLANLVTTLVGIIALADKMDKASQWKGWVDTQVKANTHKLGTHSVKLDDLNVRLSRHEGHENRPGHQG